MILSVDHWVKYIQVSVIQLLEGLGVENFVNFDQKDQNICHVFKVFDEMFIPAYYLVKFGKEKFPHEKPHFLKSRLFVHSDHTL